jgi:hypothetical protein
MREGADDAKRVRACAMLRIRDGAVGDGATLMLRLILANGRISAHAPDLRKSIASRTLTTSPTMISVGDSSAASSTAPGSACSVLVTMRCVGSVPCETTAAGVSGDRPCRTSSRHSSGSATSPM